MAIETSDLLVAYRSASNSHFKLSVDNLNRYIQNGIDTLVYRGTVDVTVEKPSVLTADTPLRQDFYVNTGSGTFHASWADVTSNAEPGDPANPGDFMIYNQTDYDYVPAGAPPATDSLWVENNDVISPVNPDAAIDGGEYAT